MRRIAQGGHGLGFSAVAEDPGVQLAVITIGLTAVTGGTGWQVTCLLALAAWWLALVMPRSGSDGGDPGHGGDGGGGSPELPTPIPPNGTATK